MAPPCLSIQQPVFAGWQTASKLATFLTVILLFVIDAARDVAAQQPQAAPLQLTFSPWVRLCNKTAEPNAKQICVIVKDGRTESGLLVVSVALIEMDGEARKLIRISMPYGVALQHGTRLIVDQDTPSTSPFVTCLPPAVPPGGCIADYEASVDLIDRLKKGQYLTIQAIHMNGQAMSPQLPLNDFARAYDGPPTDPKKLEELQKNPQKPFMDDRLHPNWRQKVN